jgi:hypothetical protein
VTAVMAVACDEVDDGDAATAKQCGNGSVRGARRGHGAPGVQVGE